MTVLSGVMRTVHSLSVSSAIPAPAVPAFADERESCITLDSAYTMTHARPAETNVVNERQPSSVLEAISAHTVQPCRHHLGLAQTLHRCALVVFLSELLLQG